MALHIDMTIPARREEIMAALEGLVGLDVVLMQRAMAEGRPYPPLYATDILYREEPIGEDDWKSCDRLLEDGEGDCEDHAGYRVAELRCQGDAGAYAEVIETDEDGKFHAIVCRGDGVREDPSKEMIEKERRSSNTMKPTLNITEANGHCIGSVTVPLSSGHTVEVHELGFDAWSAIDTALQKTWDIISNPAVSAMLPPQAGIAIQLAKRISDMTPSQLNALIADPKATDAQRALAKQLLKAKGGTPPATDDRKVASQTLNDWSVWQKGSGGVGNVYGPKLPHALGASRAWTGAAPVGVNLREHRPGVGPAGAPLMFNAASIPANLVPPGMATPGVFTHGAPPAGSAAVSPGGPGTATATMPSSSSSQSMTLPQPGMMPPGMMPPTMAPGAPSNAVPGGFLSIYGPTGQQVPGFVWADPQDGVTPGHWERPVAGTMQPTPQNPVIYPGLPGGGVQQPYGGYPYGSPYPPPYGPQYPAMPYGYGYPSGSPYGYPSPMPGPYGYPAYDASWQQWAPTMPVMPPGWEGANAEPLSLEDAAAVTIWGPQAFAEGSYPGYM